jgi:hypothetical protein
MSLRHPKPAPTTPLRGSAPGALPIRCELLLVATLEDAGELVGQLRRPNTTRPARTRREVSGWG